MSRLTIRRLLEDYNDLVDPMSAGNRRGDTGLRLMPRTYKPSVRELERLLRVMRDDRSHPLTNGVSLRACWWHINAWYITAHIVLVRPTRQPRSRKHQLVRLPIDDTGKPLPIRVTRRTHGARNDIAEQGITWILHNWNLPTEPMYPNPETQ
jgi:hypothetical protein